MQTETSLRAERSASGVEAERPIERRSVMFVRSERAIDSGPCYAVVCRYGVGYQISRRKEHRPAWQGSQEGHVGARIKRPEHIYQFDVCEQFKLVAEMSALLWTPRDLLGIVLGDEQMAPSPWITPARSGPSQFRRIQNNQRRWYQQARDPAVFVFYRKRASPQ